MEKKIFLADEGERVSDARVEGPVALLVVFDSVPEMVAVAPVCVPIDEGELLVSVTKELRLHFSRVICPGYLAKRSVHLNDAMEGYIQEQNVSYEMQMCRETYLKMEKTEDTTGEHSQQYKKTEWL